MPKHYRNTTVYEAAKERVREAILGFDDFYVSFSGGKDNGALLHLVLENIETNIALTKARKQP